MPVQRLQRETTSTEFVEWLAYMRHDLGVVRREEYYLAQIACEVRRVLRSNPNSVKLRHFLFKFMTGGEKETPPTQEEVEKRTALSKARWFAIVGVGKKPVVRRPPGGG